MRLDTWLSRAAFITVLTLAACSASSTAADPAAEVPPMGTDEDSDATNTSDAIDAGPSHRDAKDSGTTTKQKDASGPPVEPDAAVDAGPPAATCDTLQPYPSLSAAEEQAIMQKFVAQNGSGWAATSAKPTPLVVSQLRGAVDSGERTDAPGPAKSLTKAEAQATAIAFLQSNWDLLGFQSAAGPAAIKGAFDLQDGTPGGFHLQFDSTEQQADYKHIENGALWLRFRIQIGPDGQVRSFAEITFSNFRLLTMEPYPSKSPTWFRDQLNGLDIYKTGIKVKPTDTVNLGGLELSSNASGLILWVKYWMNYNGKTYWWWLDSCTGEVHQQSIGG